MMLESMIALVIGAFIFAFIDGTVGTGYGTILTPGLLLFGFTPLQIVPSVIASGIFAGLLAGIIHNHFGNVAFGQGKGHFKIMSMLAGFGALGTVLAVLLAVNLPTAILELYIALVILAVGIFIILLPQKKFAFSWPKIIGVGVLAAFNKGMSAAGYGSVVTGGQVLSGVNPKNAVAITALAEAFVSMAAIAVYMAAAGAIIDWTLMPFLTIGAIPAVPLAVLTVKRLHTKKLRSLMGIVITILGFFILARMFFPGVI